MLISNHKMILCASNTSLTAGIWHGNRLHSMQVFTNTEQGHTDFSAYLIKNHLPNIYLIANSIDEDYRVESLPHTTGKTRTEILQRKLNQFSRNAVYRTAHFINRDTDKRKDDHFLFVALNNTDFLSGWINAINTMQAPLVGIYMLPMISQEIIRLQKDQVKMQQTHILLCEQLTTGLRQSYLQNGKLRMSRILPFRVDTSQPYASTDVEENKLSAFYATEIDKTRLYLISQRLASRDTALHVVFPSLDDNTAVCQHIAQQINAECVPINLYNLAKPHLVTPELLRLNPELLHMQLLANGFLPANLAPVAITKTYQLSQLRSAIIIASIVSGIIGLLVLILLLYKSYLLNDEIQIKQAETTIQQHLYNEVSKNFPTSPIVSSELKTAVDLALAIKTNSKTPARLMQVLSKAFDEQPQIQLARLRWVLSNDSSIKDDETNNVAPTSASAKVDATTGDPLNLLEIGFINAEIKDFNGDYRAALNSVTRFVAMLKTDPAVAQVTVVQEPVNVSSFANLQGSTADVSANERPPAVFKLKLVLTPESSNESAINISANNKSVAGTTVTEKKLP